MRRQTPVTHVMTHTCQQQWCSRDIIICQSDTNVSNNPLRGVSALTQSDMSWRAGAKTKQFISLHFAPGTLERSQQDQDDKAGFCVTQVIKQENKPGF